MPTAKSSWFASTRLAIASRFPSNSCTCRSRCLAKESVHSVLVGEVNLALVTAPPQDAQITAVFAPAPLYAVLPEDHPAAQKESLALQDLAKDEWILFPKRFDPVVFDAIMDAAQSGSIAPKYAHDVIAPQQAVELVSEDEVTGSWTPPLKTHAPYLHFGNLLKQMLSNRSDQNFSRLAPLTVHSSYQKQINGFGLRKGIQD